MQKNHLVPKNCVMWSAPCISVPPNDKIGAQCSGSDFDDGPSGAIRTRGFQLPKLAPYRLGYTRKYEVLAFVLLLYHARRCGQACGHGPVFREMQGRGDPREPSKIRASQVSRRRRRTACVHAPKAGALPTGLHPDIHHKKLASFRCRSPAAGERLPPNDGGSPPFPLRS